MAGEGVWEGAPGGEETDHAGPWPAFVDLFAATALILLVFFIVMAFVFIRAKGNGVRVRELREELEELARSQHGAFQVEQDGNDVRITLEENVTFPQSQWALDSLKAGGKDALRNIGHLVNDSSGKNGPFRSLIREIEVVGHADKWKFQSGDQTNWGISAARAATVAQFLVDDVGLDACIIIPSGRGEYFPRDTMRPIQSSKDPRNALDRRIELLLHPAITSEAGKTRSGCRRNR